MDQLQALCARIRRPDAALYVAAARHLDTLTKPQGSLGYIERIAARLFAIQAGRTPIAVDPARLFIVAADHGVAVENVSPFPQAVTRQMVQNFLAGGAAVNVLCRSVGMDFMVVDAGCVGGAFAPHPRLVDARLGEGTANIAVGPAMSPTTCLQALRIGIDLAAQAVAQGYRCLGAGEMGIANTTTAAALLCRLLGLLPHNLTGTGAGTSLNMLPHKVAVVQTALDNNPRQPPDNPLNAPDALDTLAALGGFEIAVMAGIMLGGAAHGLPILVDGFISTAAFVAACALSPAMVDYAFIAHSSAERGQNMALDALGNLSLLFSPSDMRPLLDLYMRLGEGTGAALALPLLRAAGAIYNDMATFAQAGIAEKVCAT